MLKLQDYFIFFIKTNNILGVYVHIWRVPGPAGLHSRVVGLPFPQWNLAPGVPRGKLGWSASKTQVNRIPIPFLLKYIKSLKFKILLKSNKSADIWRHFNLKTCFRHTAVLHDGAMWVFGGMTDLNERQDCWKFDLGKIFFQYYWIRTGSQPYKQNWF